MIQQMNTPIKFKADTLFYPVNYNNRYTPPMPESTIDDVFLMQAAEEQKAKKKEKSKERWYKTGIIAQVGLAVAFGVMAVGTIIGLKKGGANGASKNIKLIWEDISKKQNFPSLSDDCVNPKVKNFIEKTIKILDAPKDFLKYTGADAPRMVLFHGPTGTGKTFSAKLMAKEMGAEYGEIQFSDLSSEYIGKTAVNISQKFKEIAKMAKKNPDKKYVVTFNEIDSLINNVNKLGPNNQHLGQNRTSFLNGLDSIKDIKNLTVIGTTNINPKTANLDAATLSRLGNIFEIEKPVQNEIKSSMKFHLGKSEAARDLIKNDAELDKIAELIKQKNGAQRDVENVVKTAISDFTVKNLDNPNKNTAQITSDYLLNAINNKETWAAGIETGAANPASSITENKLMEAFWKFVAKANGAI